MPFQVGGMVIRIYLAIMQYQIVIMALSSLPGFIQGKVPGFIITAAPRQFKVAAGVAEGPAEAAHAAVFAIGFIVTALKAFVAGFHMAIGVVFQVAAVNTCPNAVLIAVAQLAQPFIQVVAGGSAQLQAAVGGIACRFDVAAGFYFQGDHVGTFHNWRVGAGAVFIKQAVGGDILCSSACQHSVFPLVGTPAFLAGFIVAYLYAQRSVTVVDLSNLEHVTCTTNNIAVDADNAGVGGQIIDRHGTPAAVPQRGVPAQVDNAAVLQDQRLNGVDRGLIAVAVNFTVFICRSIKKATVAVVVQRLPDSAVGDGESDSS